MIEDGSEASPDTANTVDTAGAADTDGKKKGNLSRRDFLKLLLGGGAAGLLRRYWPYLENLGREPEEEDNFAAIEPRFRIGFHGLRRTDLEENTALVGGETFSDLLYNYFDEPYPERQYEKVESKRLPEWLENLIHPATRSSSADGIEFALTLKQMRQKGRELLIGDARHWESFGYQKILESSNKANERLFSLITAGLSASVLKFAMLVRSIKKTEGLPLEQQQKIYQERLEQQNIKAASPEAEAKRKLEKALLGLLTAGCAAEAVNPKGAFGDVMDLMVGLQRGLLTIGESDLAKLLDTIGLRNLNMAHNMHLGQGLVEGMPELKKRLASKFGDRPDLLFFCGTGHGRAEDIYRKGVEFSAEELGWEAKRVLAWSEKRLRQAGNSEEDRAEALTVILTLTSSFNYPLASFMRDGEYLNRPVNREALPSGRAILWAEMAERLKSEPKNRELITITELLAEEDIQFQKFIGPALPQIEERINGNRERQMIALPVGKLLYFSEGISWVAEGGKCVTD